MRERGAWTAELAAATSAAIATSQSAAVQLVCPATAVPRLAFVSSVAHLENGGLRIRKKRF